MASRWWMATVSLFALTACLADDQGSGPTNGSGSTAPPTSIAPTAPETTAAVTTSQEPAVISVIGEPGSVTTTRLEQLALFGYGIRPSVAPHTLDVPDLQAQFPALAVRSIDLNWGIDSSAVVLAADGDPDTIARARDRLRQSTNWLLSDDRWLIGLYQGGLSAGFEMNELAEIASWVMEPESACDRSDQACPAGPAIGFPPPPPRLVVNGATADQMAFEIVELDASSIEPGTPNLTWVAGGQGFTTWADPREAGATQTLGPASQAHSVGGFAFVVAPATPERGSIIELRSCCDQAVTSAWSVPEEWDVTGVALVGNHRQGDDRLVVVADADDGAPTAVALPLDERFFDPRPGIRPATVVGTLPPANPPDRPWSLPQRNTVGGLLVVEQRPDGWYLIDDALDGRRDLVHSRHPIISYSVAAGGRHIAVIVEGPDGADSWWISDFDVTPIPGTATSLAWHGSHRVESLDAGQ